MRKLFLFFGCLLVLSCQLLTISSSAQETPQPLWTKDGIVINDTSGNALQEKPLSIDDGWGNTIVIWEDGRNGATDIYAQKIDEAGTLLWTKDGAAICTAAGNQNTAQLTSDGSGGAIIVWQDFRNGDANIYAQHINANGSPLWGRDGLPVCKAYTNQQAPQLTSDGSGGAIIAWYDYRSNSGEDIYAQHINTDGQVLWQNDGVAISTASGTQWYPQIGSDGNGGAIIAWSDGRNGASNNDIYAQRLDANGSPVWEKNGTPICSASGNQEKPLIISSEANTGAIIVWQDSRNQNTDIYAQKLDLSGNASWTKDGVAVCTFAYPQTDPRPISDGSGGVIVVWDDQRDEKSDIYAQRIYSNGQIAWGDNGNIICQAFGEQKSPAITRLKNDEWLIVWQDELPDQRKIDLFGQKINAAGTLLWDERGLPIASSKGDQKAPILSNTNRGEAIIIWEDTRGGNLDLYAQKISSDGLLAWKNGLLICAARGSVIQQNIILAPNGQGEVIAVFEDSRYGYSNIYAQKVNKSGTLTWGRDGLAVARAAANQLKPALLPDGKGGGYVAWEDYRVPDEPKIRLQHLSTRGQRLWETSIVLGDARGAQTNPLLIGDNSGGVIVIWQDTRDVLNLDDLYAQRVNSQGDLLWGNRGKVLVATNGEQVDAAATADGSGGIFLTWTDYRRGDRNPDIYAQHINAKGELLWNNEGAIACVAPDIQRGPKIIRDGEGGIIVSWTDKGSGSYDIYAQRLNKSGKPMWMTDGIPINQVSRTQQDAAFGNRKIIVWEDYRFGNWDIFAQAIAPGGKLLWGNDGVPVVSLPQTQFAPQIVSWKDGSIIVAWEDYRNGKDYGIYMQRLGTDGQPAWENNGIKVQTQDGARKPKLLAAPSDNSLYVFWEDYTGGGKAICGQRYLLY